MKSLQFLISLACVTVLLISYQEKILTPDWKTLIGGICLTALFQNEIMRRVNEERGYLSHYSTYSKWVQIISLCWALAWHLL
jgi:hypothetical protein